MTRYVSTRGLAAPRDFEGVLLAGLAEDGGLFVPESWPRLTPAEFATLRGLDYPALTARLLAPLTTGCFDEPQLLAMAKEVQAGFGHAAMAPLKQLGPDLWLLELFHGPTLAFKDFAMQLLARMFEAVLARRRQRITIVGATSGDTGAAAVAALAGSARIDLLMLHPHGRVSPVQRRQMTTTTASNVLNLAIRGSFDDCQDLVKALFGDIALRQKLALSAVNSINWARVAAQLVYYVYAALRLGAPDRPVAFTVPTGNFGNVYAGWAAGAMGLPLAGLRVATNSNDILARFFTTGSYALGEVVPTASPSMDIQVASNFERLLLVMEGHDPAAVRARMDELCQHRTMTITAAGRAAASLIGGCRADEAETAAELRRTLAATGELVDPHTAVGLHAARLANLPAGVPMVALATAHPAKFPEAVEAATGRRPRLPDRLADLMDRPERVTVMDNDLGALRALLLETFAPS